MDSVESSRSDLVEGQGSEDQHDPYYVEDPGYRFFHLSNVHQAFQHSHKCKNAKILFNEDQAKCYGQSALFSLQCSKCKKKTYLPTSKSTGNNCDPNHADINRCLVYAASETGIGRETHTKAYRRLELVLSCTLQTDYLLQCNQERNRHGILSSNQWTGFVVWDSLMHQTTDWHQPLLDLVCQSAIPIYFLEIPPFSIHGKRPSEEC